MLLNRDWLWDRKISSGEAKNILANPENRHFFSLAGILLSRKNTPKEVFRDYLDPLIFFQNWNKIKSQMRKDDWNNPRIEFWQAIYENLREKYKNRGITVPNAGARGKPHDEFCNLVASKIKAMRRKKGLTQSALAKRLKISQQMISRIENGNENISLLTLKKVAVGLGAGLHLEFSDEK